MVSCFQQETEITTKESECLIMSLLSYEVLYLSKFSGAKATATFETKPSAHKFIKEHLNEWSEYKLTIKAAWDYQF